MGTISNHVFADQSMKEMASNIATHVADSHHFAITSPQPMESVLEFQSPIQSTSQDMYSL
jgi:hypothetical protein